MSDDDRLADYLARMDNPDHVRELEDGCGNCGHSKVYCHVCIYRDLGPCCSSCSGH